MNSWKERWLKELDAKIPVLDESVKNAPIEVKTQENRRFRNGLPLIRSSL